ncbi:hypothetical protein PMI06_006403 [Burkholderia sp. BT03]|nr:hypothetical protein PMI06_006403 [Burkholderia sp. BT03]
MAAVSCDETVARNEKGLAEAKPFESFGRPYGIRTCDQRIKSPLLYQLS